VSRKQRIVTQLSEPTGCLIPLFTETIATLITTNLDYDEWYGFLGQKEMVGALLDRLRHRCTTIRINGSSLRTETT